MPSILLHSCCAPCATYTVKYLREQGFEVTALWYNPNIHPYLEHQRRFESMRMLNQKISLPLIETEAYDMIEYFRRVVGHEGKRCADCYRLRMERTAEIASQRNFDMFTTTLLISPYQDHKLIDETGRRAAEEAGVEFYYHDFSDGFRESHRLAREMELYLQKYCGCVYSEWERYARFRIG